MSRSPRRPLRRLDPRVALLAAISTLAMTVIATDSRADPVTAAVSIDFARVVTETDPAAIGVGSSTYGANPLSSTAQASAERRLDARTVRIPAGYRNGRVTSSAAGSGGTLDVPALVRTYRSWGYQVIVVIGGRTNDVDVRPGDATKIIQALGFDGITYTAPNEPGNHGKTMQDQIDVATMIVNEGRALRPDFQLVGPVWAYYDRGALTRFASAMGDRLGGLDYHHYAMGSTSLSTARALAETPVYGTEVATLRRDLQARRLDVPVIVDELNFSWRYEDGTPGGNNRFFTAVNNVWMTSALGHILEAGGRALPYATQNGPLGVMVEAGQLNPDRRPTSSPMPAYWAIANWTGGGLWPHYKDTVYRADSSQPLIESFAVNNEAGGYNILLLNKSEKVTTGVSLDIDGIPAGSLTAYRNDPAAPYDAPAIVRTAAFGKNPQLAFDLPAMTVTVVVLEPDGTVVKPTTTAPNSTTSAPSTSSTTARPATSPSAPQGLSVTRSAAGTEATVRWSAPASSGGSAMTGYRVGRDGRDTSGGGRYSTTVSPATRSFVFTLLDPAATYTLTVAGINSVGEGAAASVVTVPAFTAPTNLTAEVGAIPSQATIRWSPPTSTGGEPVTGYQVARDGTDSKGKGAWSTTRPADAREFTFTLLNPDTTYTFTVKAITETGLGPQAQARLTTP